jgi:hypothetical protein
MPSVFLSLQARLGFREGDSIPSGIKRHRTFFMNRNGRALMFCASEGTAVLMNR